MNAPFPSIGIAFDALGVSKAERIRCIEYFGSTVVALEVLNHLIDQAEPGSITAFGFPNYTMKLNYHKPHIKPPVIATTARELYEHMDRMTQPRRERARRTWSRLCDRLPAHCHCNN